MNKRELVDLLDQSLCVSGFPPERPVVTPIARALTAYRNTVSPDEWRETIRRDLRPHPMFTRLHEDPYSCYGFRKPRGYPGDAVLLDFIYGGGSSLDYLPGASEFGLSLYRECSNHPSFVSIRARRDYLRGRLSRLLQTRPGIRVLSVACGHLRELDGLPVPNQPPDEGRFVVLDQDAATLDRALRDHRHWKLIPAQRSVLSLLRPGCDLGNFDFIYSAGLYDYLSDEAARRLTKTLAGMLSPGGQLLIANMLPDLPSAAYMEAVMDWWLMYRETSELRALSSVLDTSYSASMHDQPFVSYLEIEKKA